jgi:dipeptidyl aminopeptidase/acylaminoacyl peptidase
MEYPHEGHIPVEPAAVADMLARILRWIGAHLPAPGGEG